MAIKHFLSFVVDVKSHVCHQTLCIMAQICSFGQGVLSSLKTKSKTTQGERNHSPEITFNMNTETTPNVCSGMN